jgi:outer membrane lipoprotein carrier protein
MIMEKIMKFKKFKILLIIFILLVAVSEIFSAEVDDVLKDIEKNMKNVKTVQARFVQNKKMAMFDMPVTIKGELYIENPDKFAWVVIDPIKYTLIITDDTVKKWDPSTGINKLALKKNPMFKAMVEQITFWFSGSYASCKKNYHIDLITDESIVLKFIPKKHNQASQILSSITLVFQNNKQYISKIQLLEKNSDLTEILFNDTKINSEIAKSVWELN